MEVEKEINYIDEIVKNKKRERNITEHAKRNAIFKIVTNFIEKKHLITYGGIALNNILPQGKKIYGKYDTPDYDCLSYKAREHAIELADTLFEHGIEYTEVRPALHNGTYKVFANFIPVADITEVSEKLFITLAKMSEEQRGILKANDNPKLIVVPLHLIKHYILKEFSRPEGSLYRWKKLIDRYHKLEKVYYSTPLKVDIITETKGIYSNDPDINKLIKDLGEVIRLRKYPIVGSHAIKLITGTFCRQDDFFSVYEILAKDPEKTCKNIFSFLDYDKKKIKVIVSKRFYHPEILPGRLRVFLKIKGVSKLFKLMTIIDTETSCYSTIKRQGYSVGSPFTILQFLYAYWIIYKVYEEPPISEHVQKMINTLEYHVKKKIPLREMFSTECFGHEKTIDTLRKEKWSGPNKLYIYRPTH